MKLAFHIFAKKIVKYANLLVELIKFLAHAKPRPIGIGQFFPFWGYQNELVVIW
jgi:hypothetical protein